MACNGPKLLFDPYISPNPLAKKIDIDATKADYILLFHGHDDHMVDVELIYHTHFATIIANLELGNWHWYKKIGITKSLPAKPRGKQALGWCH